MSICIYLPKKTGETGQSNRKDDLYFFKYRLKILKKVHIQF